MLEKVQYSPIWLMAKIDLILHLEWPAKYIQYIQTPSVMSEWAAKIRFRNIWDILSSLNEKQFLLPGMLQI